MKRRRIHWYTALGGMPHACVGMVSEREPESFANEHGHAETLSTYQHCPVRGHATPAAAVRSLPYGRGSAWVIDGLVGSGIIVVWV